MSIEIIKEDGLTTTYLIKDTKPALVNSIRRMIVSEVPVLAIEDVFVSKNNSALYDEMLSHRLGLIPLTTPDSYTLPENCKCKGKGCARCTVKLTLKSKGPGIVLAKEFKSLDPAVKPVFGEMPIVYLEDKQELELEVSAVLGRGKIHTKWAGGSAYHQYYPKIKIDSAKIKDVKKCAEACPKGLLKVTNGKLEFNKSKVYDCDICGACEEACPEGIKAEGDENNIILTVESWGQIEPKIMFNKAVELIKDNLATVKKSL